MMIRGYQLIGSHLEKPANCVRVFFKLVLLALVSGNSLCIVHLLALTALFTVWLVCVIKISKNDRSTACLSCFIKSIDCNKILKTSRNPLSCLSYSTFSTTTTYISKWAMTKILPPLSLTMDLECVKVRKVLYSLPVGHQEKCESWRRRRRRRKVILMSTLHD